MKQEMPKIFYNNQTRRKYTCLQYNCNGCGDILTKALILYQSFGKKKSFVKTFCLKCANQIFETGEVTSYDLVIVVPNIPAGSYQILLDTPEMHNTGISSFEAAQVEYDRKIKSDTSGYTTKDKAYASKDKNFMIQSDAKDKLQLETEYEHSEALLKDATTAQIMSGETSDILSSDEADDFLKSLMNSKAVTSRFDDEQDKLEDKRGDEL